MYVKRISEFKIQREVTIMEILVKKAMKGDNEAFALLMKNHMQSMYKTAWIYLKNEQDIADAVQDTILTCYEKIDTLRSAKYFKTWMIRILINKCNDMLRKRSIYLPQEEGMEMGITDPELERCEWKQLLGYLDETSREIVNLYYYEELTVPEIAAVLDMNRNTVMTKLDRARKKLQKIL
jgi:RNA polymerase sigma-70 factor (ECF subfamily)